MKYLKVILKVFKRIMIGIICLFVGLIAINFGLTMHEKNEYKPIGQMVKVDGKKVHVYIKGEGENTVVLMSGLGTVSPVLDFEPLINELSKENKVVVVEGFGYGWSDQTDKPRLVSNIVEEMRVALKQVGITEQVILMPHSISGMYAIYYANEYPDEVKGIAGIDCTLPKMSEYFNEETPVVPDFIQYFAPLGIVRLDALFNPEDVLPTEGKENYSKQNLLMTAAMTKWHTGNKNIIMETKAIDDNMKTTLDMRFPKELPVLLFIQKDDRVTEDGKTSKGFYEMYLKGLKQEKLVELNGKHYLHRTCSKEMAKEFNEFFSKTI